MAYESRILLAAASQGLRTRPTVSLTTLAEACGVSASTLKRAVHVETGLSYGQWRQAVLLKRIKGILGEGPPRSIKQISNELGFASSRSFARWLKRTCGLAPTAYRHMLARRPGVGQST